MSGNFFGDGDSDDFVGALRILDVSDPTAPVEVGALSTSDRAASFLLFDDQGASVFVANGLFFFADFDADAEVRALIVDVSDPSNPVAVGSLRLPRGGIFGGAIFASEGLAFVAAGDQGRGYTVHALEALLDGLVREQPQTDQLGRAPG